MIKASVAKSRIAVGLVMLLTASFAAAPSAAGAAEIVSPNLMRTAAGDFNGDGIDDILWYGPGSRADELWTGTRGQDFSKRSLNITGDWFPQVGDLNNDGRDDIVWYSPRGGRQWIWYGTSTVGRFSAKSFVAGAGYEHFVGDFNGDGRHDILWYLPTAKRHWIWSTQANGTFSGRAFNAAPGYDPFIGDFDGNGRDDIFWYHPTGGDWVWFGTGSWFQGEKRNASGGFKPIVGDIDADGDDDIFWFRPGTGRDYLWLHEGRKATLGPSATINDTRIVVVTGDFNGDNRDDLYYQRY